MWACPVACPVHEITSFVVDSSRSRKSVFQLFKSHTSFSGHPRIEGTCQVIMQAAIFARFSSRPSGVGFNRCHRLPNRPPKGAKRPVTLAGPSPSWRLRKAKASTMPATRLFHFIGKSVAPCRRPVTRPVTTERISVRLSSLARARSSHRANRSCQNPAPAAAAAWAESRTTWHPRRDTKTLFPFTL